MLAEQNLLTVNINRAAAVNVFTYSSLCRAEILKSMLLQYVTDTSSTLQGLWDRDKARVRQQKKTEKTLIVF